eukprot:5134646-Alexandrium_andersonii.AAC.1
MLTGAPPWKVSKLSRSACLRGSKDRFTVLRPSSSAKRSSSPILCWRKSRLLAGMSDCRGSYGSTLGLRSTAAAAGAALG